MKEKSGIEVDVDLLIDETTSKVEAALEIQLSKGKASLSEIRRATEIAEEKFAAEKWTKRR